MDPLGVSQALWAENGKSVGGSEFESGIATIDFTSRESLAPLTGSSPLMSRAAVQKLSVFTRRAW